MTGRQTFPAPMLTEKKPSTKPEIPRCPITLELLTDLDPNQIKMATDGRCYDSEAIQHYLATSNNGFKVSPCDRTTKISKIGLFKPHALLETLDCLQQEKKQTKVLKKEINKLTATLDKKNDLINEKNNQIVELLIRVAKLKRATMASASEGKQEPKRMKFG